MACALILSSNRRSRNFSRFTLSAARNARWKATNTPLNRERIIQKTLEIPDSQAAAPMIPKERKTAMEKEKT